MAGNFKNSLLFSLLPGKSEYQSLRGSPDRITVLSSNHEFHRTTSLGSDCGFATFASSKEIHASIVWAKLEQALS
jgi:hypothetical protein